MDPRETITPLWAHVEAKRRERRDRAALKRDLARGGYYALAAVIAAVAATSGRSNGPFAHLFELVGRVTVFAGIYLALVYGAKAAWPNAWRNRR